MSVGWPLREVPVAGAGLFGLLPFRRPEKAAARRPVAPAGSRVYAIGDIHGRADQLEILLRRIERDPRDADEHPLAVFLGDYVDRGPQVRETLELLSSGPLPGFECRFLMGNHEEALLQFLDGGGEALSPWLSFGGEATLLSYGVPRPAGGYAAGDPQALRAELGQRIPPRHLAFLRGLALSCRHGELFFVHAGVRPGVPLDRQAPEDLLWIREPFLGSEEDHGMVVVHGHSVIHRPEIRGNRVAVDTGAYATGVLTAAVFSAKGVRFLVSRP